MTNAEKVRSMTDEELAKLMNEDPFVKYLFPTKYCEIVNAGENPGFCDDDCYDCILKWLKEEAKEKEEKPKRIEICIENENEEFEHEGYYDSVDSAIQALRDLKETDYSLDYHMYCPYKYAGCIHDPGYIFSECPNWYKELYGDMSPEEVARTECLKYCKDGSDYDDEDK